MASAANLAMWPGCLALPIRGATVSYVGRRSGTRSLERYLKRKARAANVHSITSTSCTLLARSTIRRRARG
ncbi:hypothetical protein B0T20DRAFT_417318 [Sordaria brevicollis]|uniref:Secreted protein n=1 Tax=Sordaria brevicollis TaxID=83679 RepID=A0AAE0UAD0_SORBR|nr:hypothetical protein B0T20DRAFT_417318 [Sordaria brevicollis]